VVLDLGARDGRGRLMSDLRADELQVFEDGKRCRVESFRLVAAARAAKASPVAGSPQVAGNAPMTGAPQPSAPSRANVVLLLFDLLGVNTAPSVRGAALDLLGRSFPPNTWFAVYKVTEDGTRLLQALTTDHGRLREAVLTATTGDDAKRFGRAAEPNAAQMPSPAAGLLGPPSSSAGEMAARTETGERGHFRGRAELATFSGMQWIVSSLADVRGRKAIVYFAADHQLGGGEISGGRASLAYAAAMSDANRANVTVHTVDAGGLTCVRVGGRSAFDQTCGIGAGGATGGGGALGTGSWATATEAPDKGGASLLGDPERVGSPASEKFLSYKSGSLLEHVAEETGGLAITKTNDLAAGLVRVVDELREYYEVVYTPPDPVLDGRFRRIEVKVNRRGVQVRTRAGYFATLGTTPTIPRSSLR
jgi:VWFA-related protein